MEAKFNHDLYFELLLGYKYYTQQIKFFFSQYQMKKQYYEKRFFVDSY